MTTLSDVRSDFVDYVRRQLVGPFDGPTEIIFDPPNRRYLMGTLHPRKTEFAGYVQEEGEPEDESATAAGGDESRFSDDPVSAANDFLPASQGLSFFTTASELTINARAAEYELLSGAAAVEALADQEVRDGGPTEEQDEDPRRKSPGSRRIWRRKQLPDARVFISAEKAMPRPIWDGKAEIHVRWREYPHGNLVTVTLVNARSIDGESPKPGWEDILLQVEFDVSVDGAGELLEYPSVTLVSHDPEEEELRLMHRKARVFAIGHGCSPEWREIEGMVTGVRTEVMPSFVVPRVRPDGDSMRALDIAWLADASTDVTELVRELDAFVDPYSMWIERVSAEAAALDERYKDAAASVIDRLVRARDRMRAGVRVFAQHPDRARLIEAFRLANRAMLIQRRHSEDDLAGTRHPRVDAPEAPTNYLGGAEWRPFQLGFFLTTLRGVADPADEDRNVVDLIWFPTGGGKTEAYLLVAAFEIFRRRLTEGAAGGGTAVVSRYTLSLLTAQQFQRTASMIVACEYLRRENPVRLGDEPISVGLWVGEATTPNRYVVARDLFDELRDAGETDDRFLLERCPWCGTEIVPREHSDDDADYGIVCTDQSFEFRCPSTICEFHDELPVRVIDDALYASPPTFLLGTVDKFAQLAWVPESGKLFGRANGTLPPSLIIQDELHLLTGPLGTTVGLYEAAINLLCEWKGRPPKVIASTATIRRATAQIKGLFGRPVDLFPPAGIDAGDSYFAREDKSSPGRLYVGMMAQGHTFDTAVVHSGTALLQAPIDLGLSGAARDAYWTVVAYHSSLRELGKTVTIARDDIHSRLDSLIVNRPKREYDVDELSSTVPRAQQPRLLERLNKPCSDKNSVHFLATSSMLSVGVDVPRLGLMLMNGQPKATAEYIQATSRVGRSTAPGLVFDLFRATKPRDRSHYENFRGYHSALYRHVEPTSVTPYSPPSRERALHAALVILVRHKLGLNTDGRAGEIIEHEAEVRELADKLIEVVERVEPRERVGARSHLDRFIDDWLDRARRAHADNKLLYYKPNGKGHINLIKPFHAKGDAWPTLGSMRNVDMESLIEVLHGAASSKGKK
ncbi:helicase-related protein [Nocardia cyriacigeorgica]|uniref:Helicase n=1 Tax=Nocardia cyriacigeorgica TaxID=135487 RepID=A0A5R8PE81_9NOCA|nr:helicase-related protein [Nocardia cyriacigeorgica]MBF6095724.1 helicase [Nocardia cyriacigeorgica]TLF73674.1 helicase [Nocardia cyriacigeorgica]TLG10236.1 helicase [Nocardia cyriacigeorgica]